MCQIIVQVPGAPMLDENILRAEWAANPHGGGIMFSMDGELYTGKFTKLKMLIAEYKQAWELAGTTSPMVLHFRYATHGTIGIENTHPFEIADGTVGVVHNGMFEGLGDTKFSDTYYFAKYALGGRTREELMSKGFLEWLDEVCGWGRVVLLDKTGDISIANMDWGRHDEHGNWYSAPRAVPGAPNVREIGKYTGKKPSSFDPWWWDGADVDEFEYEADKAVLAPDEYGDDDPTGYFDRRGHSLLRGNQ